MAGRPGQLPQLGILAASTVVAGHRRLLPVRRLLAADAQPRTRQGLAPPAVHGGWFQDTLPQELPRKICFAHIDCDYYTSVTEGLAAVYPRLADNAVVVIDDYDWEGLPGVKIAVNEFLRDKPEIICPLRVSAEFDAVHAFFRRRTKAWLVGERKRRQSFI